MHTFVSVYACVYAEQKQISVTLVTTAAQGCLSDLYMCASARLCWYYFANLSTVSVCLPVHTMTHTHTHTQATQKTQANTWQVMIENQHCHSTTVSQYSATKNTQTHSSDESPAKTPGGRADNWLLDKTSVLYRGETETKETYCKIYSEKYIYINIHTHTSMHVGMYECLRSESESELGNELSGIPRKASKQTCILVCLCMYVCMRSESESVSHSSPPQLKGVRVISACACARVCAGHYFANVSTVYVCLPVHTVTQTHTHIHTSDTNTHTHTQ
jgi:hypothetical protein